MSRDEQSLSEVELSPGMSDDSRSLSPGHSSGATGSGDSPLRQQAQLAGLDDASAGCSSVRSEDEDDRFPAGIREGGESGAQLLRLDPRAHARAREHRRQEQAAREEAHERVHGLGAGGAEETGRSTPAPAQRGAQQDPGEAVEVRRPLYCDSSSTVRCTVCVRVAGRRGGSTGGGGGWGGGSSGQVGASGAADAQISAT